MSKISYVRTTPRKRKRAGGGGEFTFNEHGSVSLVPGQTVSLNAIVAEQAARK